MGDHIRKRRLDLGLEQKATAQQIGVHVGSLWGWENYGREPEPKYPPAILTFLGYDPRPQPASFAERLVWLRVGKGWTQSELAAVLGVDPASLSSWERGEHRPTLKSREKMACVFGGAALGLQSPDADQ